MSFTGTYGSVRYTRRAREKYPPPEGAACELGLCRQRAEARAVRVAVELARALPRLPNPGRGPGSSF